MSVRLVSKGMLQLFILFVFLASPLIVSADTSMLNYCQTPPFIGGNKPNLLLMLDNSSSMYDLQYGAGSTAFTTFDCGGGISSTESFCMDDTYNNSKTYAGYFIGKIENATVYYQYQEGPVNNTSSPEANDYFVQVGAIPGGCTFGGSASTTPYVCVNYAGTNVTGFYASGNFLNWLTSSKFDVEKDILTGGKYDSVNKILTGESRGCLGRRYIKMLKADPACTGNCAYQPITFAVRGPQGPLEPDYLNPTTQGGFTRVEVYGKANPNIGKCQCAITEWSSLGSFGQAKTDTSACLNMSAVSNEMAMYNISMQDCWKLRSNIAGGATTAAQLFQGISVNVEQTQCQQIYNDVCGKPYQDPGFPGKYWCDPNKDSPGNTTDDYPVAKSTYDPPVSTAIPSGSSIPGKLTDPKRGNYFCTDGNGLVNHGAPPAPYDALGTGSRGFLGRCLTIAASGGNNAKLDFTWPDVTCVQREILHFCAGVAVPDVTDPSAGATDLISGGSIPSILMDSSVKALGDPLGTLYARVSRTPAPTGLIQMFQNQIRFGAMSFNNYGTPSECGKTGSNITCPKACSGSKKPCVTVDDCVSPETCNQIDATTDPANRDGGKVISYIGGTIGDHTTGLIKTIDDLQAVSWTPFSEAFYNAIGYYALPSGPMRLNGDDFDATKVPSQNQCQKNNIILVTDGQPTADVEQSKVKPLVEMSAAAQVPASASYDTNLGSMAFGFCYKFAGTRNVDDMAWLGQHRKISNLNVANTSSSPEMDKIQTYVVYSGTGSVTTEACPNNTYTDECKPDQLMCNTAKKGAGTYYLAQDPESLAKSLKDSLLQIAARATSGTAASVLASGEGSGANLIQALFYPRRIFKDDQTPPKETETAWAGTVQNLWYYVDPFFATSSIREDTSTAGVLNLLNDDISELFYQTNPLDPPDRVRVKRWADNGSGGKGAQQTTIDVEEIKNLWEAGYQLFKNPASDRTIYLNDGTNPGAAHVPYLWTEGNDPTALMPYLQTKTDVEAARILSWTKGYEKFCKGQAKVCDSDAVCGGAVGSCEQPYRPRTVKSGAVTGVWKLGDVLNSTPRIAAWMPLNTYNKTYGDGTYGKSGRDFNPSEGDDESAFITSRTTYPYYRTRGMVFAGANDGMLHAFKLGTLELKWSGQLTKEKAKLTNPANPPELGKEYWAFIPKHALPYLKYMADPNYCHMYTVDLSPFILDASVGGCPTCAKTKDSWRTILIGGMRYGGACRKPRVCSASTTTTCSLDTDCPGGETCTDPAESQCTDCVRTPAVDPADTTKGLGYSSYFALDITDTLASPAQPPQLLWEFTDEDLGFASSGPAVVRIGDDKSKNGNWFVVIGSGPTGPLTDQQFMGSSDQNLHLFIFDLLKGPADGVTKKKTSITNAFAGSMLYSTFDVEQDYQDDVLYFGYVKKGGGGYWDDGGVGRLVTNGSTSPGAWTFSPVIDGVGPVTAGVVKLQDKANNQLWLYFGTGRNFFKRPTPPMDDSDTQRKLVGLTEPCYDSGTFTPGCSTAQTLGTEVPDGSAAAGVNDPKGWYITLDAPQTVTLPDATVADISAERVVTDPLASTMGLVFFTTYGPYSGICNLGGLTRMWAVKYNSGAQGGALLKGKALIQVSTGSIEQIDMSTAFVKRGKRATEWIKGVPPGPPPGFIAPPPAVKRVLHMKER